MSRKLMSGNLPADVAERASDTPNDPAIDEARRKEALDDLVDRLMRGEDYPPKSSRGSLGQINRLDILIEVGNDDSLKIAAIVDDACRDVYRDGSNWEEKVEAVLREYLTDSDWLTMRTEELIEEEKEDAR